MIQSVKELLKKDDKEYLIDYFIDDAMTEKQKEEITVKVVKICNLLISSEESLNVMKGFYGDSLLEKRSDVPFIPETYRMMNRLINRINKYLGLDDETLNKKFAAKKRKEKLKLNKTNTDLDNYICDLLSSNETILEDVITDLIEKNELINDKISLFKLVLKSHPKCLIKLFKYEPYKYYLDSLTEIDKNILVMKIMGLEDELYTPEYIAQVNKVNREYVESIRLSSELEEFNILNEKLKCICL